MNTDERKAVIRDMLNSLIKADSDTAEKHFHDVLSDKTRERLNPTPVVDSTIDDDQEVDAGEE